MIHLRRLSMKKLLSIALSILLAITCLALMSCKPEAENPPEPLTYTITFDSAGGRAVESMSVKANTYVQELPEPTKEGDTFYYWYLDAQNNRFDYINTKITSDLHLKARWVSDPILYTVFFKVGDQVCDMQEVGRDGYYASRPVNPAKANSTFVYWSIEGTNEPFDFDATIIDKNVTLKAKFIVGGTADGQIKFHLGVLTGNVSVNGITSAQQQITANANDEILLPKLSITGYVDYTFIGWVNATTGQKYLIADYPNLADYKFTYDGKALMMYALWD